MRGVIQAWGGYKFILFCSEADKAISKYYLEKRYAAYKTWKDNPEKHWGKTFVKRHIKMFEAFSTMERQKGSGRPGTGTTPENEKAVEEMICSQKNHSGTHVPPKDIAGGLSISQSFVPRKIKRKRMKQFKRIKTPYINNVTLKRRAECAGCLLEKLETNSLMIERVVFQDESYFLLQISINSQNDRAYFKGQKKDVPDKNFLINLIDNLSK